MIDCEEFPLDWLKHLEECPECMAKFYKDWYHQHGEFLLENSIDLGGQFVKSEDVTYVETTAVKCPHCGIIWEDEGTAKGHWCYRLRGCEYIWLSEFGQPTRVVKRDD